MKKDKNILVVMPVKDEHKKTLEQHSQGNKFIYSFLLPVSKMDLHLQ